MDAASTQVGDLALTLSAAPADEALLESLWVLAEGSTCDLSQEEFASVLADVGSRWNYGASPGTHPDAAQRRAFLHGLKLPELALAQACALGRERAWEKFIQLYRGPLTQAATGIAGSATAGHDLADSLYAELYGLKDRDGVRQSPLRSYSGRGSLMGWLRTTLAQRHIDRHRKTHRESPLGDMDVPAAAVFAPVEVTHLNAAVVRAFQALASEDRFLLYAYFLDQRTLLEIGRILKVHEATVSRRLKRLTANLRKQLLKHLQSAGLSRRAAEETLGAHPGDLEVNLRGLLQNSQGEPFLEKRR